MTQIAQVCECMCASLRSELALHRKGALEREQERQQESERKKKVRGVMKEECESV